MKLISILAILSLCLLLEIDCGLRLRNRRLIDSQDRQIYIRGNSIVVKNPPYLPVTDRFDVNLSFNDQDLANFKELGFNGVRLGVMWGGVEPSKDFYNQTYLQEMVKLVNKLGENGIYSLIDFHQDAFSQKFCGDGVPVWLVDELNGYRNFPFPAQMKSIKLNSSGLPSWNDCDPDKFWTYYFSWDVGQMFEHLYNSHHYLHKKFVAYWKKVASYFKGNPYVVAYELINQPFVGNPWKDLFLLVPGMAERIKFQKFYDSVVGGIREIDNQTNICFQPVTFDVGFSTGFTHIPGGNKYRNKSILCYHYYVGKLPTMKSKLKDMKRLGIPVLLSQYGAQSEAQQFAEDHLQSYFCWIYKSYGKDFGSIPHALGMDLTENILNPDGTLNPNEIIRYARTSLHVVAGEVKNSYYRQNTGHFNAVYLAQPGGTSILYLSRNRLYKNGYTLDISPKGSIAIRQDNNYLHLTYLGTEALDVMISINRL